jgi:integrase/recombinase XerD
MATDFAVALRRFLTSYLAGLRGCSPATVASYRDTFRLLIAWFRDERSVPPARLSLDHLDAAAVTAFLAHLQETRHNSVATRNQRLGPLPEGWRSVIRPNRWPPPPASSSPASCSIASPVSLMSDL